MRINIKLQPLKGFFENKNIIERITKENNDAYLVKGEDNPDFPLLSQVEIDDYAVFDTPDMDDLIKELFIVRKEVKDPEDKAHIADIIRLAGKCKRMPDTVLTFAG